MIINQTDVINVLKLHPKEKVYNVKWHNDHDWLCIDELLIIHTDKINETILDFILEKQPSITDKAYLKLSEVSDDQLLIFLEWFYNQHKGGE